MTSKRRLSLVALACLALGVTTNFVVGALLVYRQHSIWWTVTSNDNRDILDPIDQWMAPMPANAPPPTHLDRVEDFGFTQWLQQRTLEPKSKEKHVLQLVILEFGWPMRSVQLVFRSRRPIDAGLIDRSELAMRMELGAKLPLRTEYGPVTVPIVPVLPGFLLNTLLYALIAYLLSLIPSALRRLRARLHEPPLSEGGMLAR